MLSINIPVYQIEISELVLQLNAQAEKLDIPYEIRIYDDGSTSEIKEMNYRIGSLPNVVYKELEKNLGRAAIRNKMGQDSRYRYLLFIDADSHIICENYLSDFIKNIKSNRVICGGTAYQKEPPKESEKLLRWVYGTKREAISAQSRNSKKGFIITSNNFMIEKSVLEKIPFREDLKNYGHEDTLLGYDLYQGKIEIFHINNPVEHTGLEDSAIFLEKTKMALRNLRFISRNLLGDNPEFLKQVHFLNRYKAIAKFFPSLFLRWIYKISNSWIEKNLTGKKPCLFLFNLYKLTFYSTLIK